MADDASLIVSVKADTAEMQKKIADLQKQLATFASSASANTAKVEKSIRSMSSNVGNMTNAIKGITTSLGAFGISAGAIGTIAKGMISAWFQVSDATKQAADAAREHRQEVEKSIAYNGSLVDKLKQLSDLSQDNYLNADGIRTANTLVKELAKSYGDLGVTVDDTTGKISGMTDAIAAIQDKDKDRRKAAIERQLSTLRNQLKENREQLKEYNPQGFFDSLAHNIRMASSDMSGYTGNVLTGNYDRYNQNQSKSLRDEQDRITKEMENLRDELARLNDNASIDKIASELEKARQNAEEQKYLRGLQSNTNVGKLQTLGEQYDKTMTIFSRQITSAEEQGDFQRVEALKQQQEDYRRNHKLQRDALKEHGTGSTFDATVATKQDAYIKALQSGDRSVIDRAKSEYDAAEQNRLKVVATQSGEDVRKAQEAYDARLKDYNDSKGEGDARRADLWRLVQEAEKDLMSKRQTYEQTTLQAYKPNQAPLQGGAAGTFNAFDIQKLLQKNLDQQQLDELKNISSLIQTAIDNDTPIFV